MIRHLHWHDQPTGDIVVGPEESLSSVAPGCCQRRYSSFGTKDRHQCFMIRQQVERASVKVLVELLDFRRRFLGLLSLFANSFFYSP